MRALTKIFYPPGCRKVSRVTDLRFSVPLVCLICLPSACFLYKIFIPNASWKSVLKNGSQVDGISFKDS